MGLGKVALASLLTDAFSPAARAAQAENPLAPKRPHFPAKAKRVIHLFMGGAPSHLELFDYKSELTKLEGKSLPPSAIAGQRYAFIRPDAAVLGPRFKFARHGQCGMELSEVLPHLAKIVDEICLIKSVRTDQFCLVPKVSAALWERSSERDSVSLRRTTPSSAPPSSPALCRNERGRWGSRDRDSCHFSSRSEVPLRNALQGKLSFRECACRSPTSARGAKTEAKTKGRVFYGHECKVLTA